MNKANRLSDVKAGVFVVVTLAILIAGSLWIAGSSVFGARRVHYRVVMNDSGGLQPGDRVRIAGVSVGRIQDLKLNTGSEQPVELVIGIRREFEIHEDSTARVATAGLMGKAYLDVAPGSPTTPLLVEGQEIPGMGSQGVEAAFEQLNDLSETAKALLEQTTTVVESVSREIGPLLTNMNALLSETNADEVSRLLTNLRATSDDLTPRVSALLTRLETIASQVEDGTAALPDLQALIDNVSTVVEDLHVALGPDGSRLTGVLDSAEKSLTSADDALSVVGGNRGELEATLRDLRDVISNLKAFSQQVKEKPFSLVRIKSEPDRKPGQGVKGDKR